MMVIEEPLISTTGKRKDFSSASRLVSFYHQLHTLVEDLIAHTTLMVISLQWNGAVFLSLLKMFTFPTI